MRALASHQCVAGSRLVVMWVESVGSLLCSERFLPSHQKPTFDFV